METGQKVYIVGQILKTPEHYWVIQGVFSTAEAAVERCRDDSYFVGPMVLDNIGPDEVEDKWPGAHYPTITPPAEEAP